MLFFMNKIIFPILIKTLPGFKCHIIVPSLVNNIPNSHLDDFPYFSGEKLGTDTSNDRVALKSVRFC